MGAKQNLWPILMSWILVNHYAGFNQQTCVDYPTINIALAYSYGSDISTIAPINSALPSCGFTISTTAPINIAPIDIQPKLVLIILLSILLLQYSPMSYS